MKITVVGTGYVGLVSGTCFAEFGIHVICVDKDTSKINALLNGEIPIYEPGLDDLVAKQVEAGRLSFTTDLGDAMQDADAVFIAVGTPPREGDGHADMVYVEAAAREIAQNMTGYIVVVNKSTVPVGTAKHVEQIIRETNPNAEFDVCSNPEFLREGAAINDFMRPDRVILGVASDRAEQVLRNLYRPLFINETPILVVSRETSELIKYASNAFLATKITFINEIANLCEATNANVQDVARGMGLDKRIGKFFLHAGPGYGGSCFPKDTLALTQTGQKLGQPQKIVEKVVEINAERQRDMAQRIIDSCGGDVTGKTIGICGVSFKPNTDDVRESPALTIIPILQKAGAIIRATDPIAMETAKPYLNNIHWVNDAYEAAENADALAIITEWNEYRALDLKTMKGLMKSPTLIDLRNIYKLSEIEKAGFNYISIGRRGFDPDHSPASFKKAS